jgi:hypothetical protein
MVRQGLKGHKEEREDLDLKGHKEEREDLDLKGHKEELDLKGHKEEREGLDLKGHKEQPEHKEQDLPQFLRPRRIIFLPLMGHLIVRIVNLR